MYGTFLNKNCEFVCLLQALNLLNELNAHNA